MVIGHASLSTITFATVSVTGIIITGRAWLEVCPKITDWDILDKNKLSVIKCNQ